LQRRLVCRIEERRTGEVDRQIAIVTVTGGHVDLGRRRRRVEDRAQQ